MFLSLKNNVFPITDKRMTRFNITIDEAIKFVLKSMKEAFGGNFYSKIPSYRIIDVAKAVNSKCKFELIGIRPGEKLHEEMITASDSYNSLELKDYYVILPRVNLGKKYSKFENEYFLRNYYLKNKNAKKLPENFSYNSYNNKHYLTINEIRKIIKNNF